MAADTPLFRGLADEYLIDLPPSDPDATPAMGMIRYDEHVDWAWPPREPPALAALRADLDALRDVLHNLERRHHTLLTAHWEAQL